MAHKGAQQQGQTAPDPTAETPATDQQQTTANPVGLIDFNTIPRAIFRVGLNGQELSTVLHIASGLELTPDDDDAVVMLGLLGIIRNGSDNQPVLRDISLDEVDDLTTAIAAYRSEYAHE